jgi:hypothetical protein
MLGGFVPARSMAAERTQRGGSRQEIEADGLSQQANTCHILGADALFEQARTKYEAEFRANRHAWAACIKAGWARRRVEGVSSSGDVEALKRRMATFKGLPATLAGAYFGLYWNREEAAHLIFKRSLQQVLDEAPLQQLSFAELMQTLEAPGWNNERLVVRAAKYGAANEFSHLLTWMPMLHPQATSVQLAHRNKRCAVWFAESIEALLKHAYVRLDAASQQEIDAWASKLNQLLLVTTMPQGDLFYGVWVELALQQTSASLLKHLPPTAFAPQTLYHRAGRYPPSGFKTPPTPQQCKSTMEADRTFVQLLLERCRVGIEPKLAYAARHDASFSKRQESTPSCMALAMQKNWSVVEALLDNGLGVNEADPVTGHTVLVEAVAHKRAEFLVALLERGANPEAVIRHPTRSSEVLNFCAMDLAQGHGYENERHILETYAGLQPARACIASWERRCGVPPQSVYSVLCPAARTAPDVERAISLCITVGDVTRLLNGKTGVTLLQDVLKWFDRAPSPEVRSVMRRLVSGLPDLILLQSLADSKWMPEAARWPLFLRILQCIPFYDASREHNYCFSATLLKELIKDLSLGTLITLSMTQTQFCSLPLTHLPPRARLETWRYLRFLNVNQQVEQAQLFCQAVCFYQCEKRSSLDIDALLDCIAVAEQRALSRQEWHARLTGALDGDENTALANLAAKGLTSIKKIAKTVMQKTAESRRIDGVTAVNWSAFQEDLSYAHCYEKLKPLQAGADEADSQQLAHASQPQTTHSTSQPPAVQPPAAAQGAGVHGMGDLKKDTVASSATGRPIGSALPQSHSGQSNAACATAASELNFAPAGASAASDQNSAQPGAVDAAADKERAVAQERRDLAELRVPLAALTQRGSRLEHDDLRSLFVAVNAAQASLSVWARQGACVSRSAESFAEADHEALDALHSALSDDATVELISGTQALGHSRKERMGMRRDVARAYASLCCLVMGPERLQQLGQPSEAQSVLRGLQRTWHPDKHRNETDLCVQQTYAKISALINVIKLRLGQNDQFFALLTLGAAPTGDLQALRGPF